jgi:hypothetical protein
MTILYVVGRVHLSKEELISIWITLGKEAEPRPTTTMLAVLRVQQNFFDAEKFIPD